MLSAVTRRTINPAARGLYALYRNGERNHCPGCGRTHWLIGRVTAECAFCWTAIPLEDARPAPAPVFVQRGKGFPAGLRPPPGYGDHNSPGKDGALAFGSECQSGSGRRAGGLPPRFVSRPESSKEK